MGSNKENALFSRDTIFHYTNRRTFLEYILPTMQIELSSYGKTNDPAEYKNLSFTGSGALFNYENGVIDSAALQKRLNIQIQENVKVACFSGNNGKNEDIYNSGFAKSRMWSQYGDDHFGVCLAIDRKKLEENIKDSISEDDLLKGKEVDYLNDPKIFIESRTIENAKAGQLAPNIYIKEHIISNFEGLFFNKNPDYKDEEEYRFAVYSNKVEDLFISIKDSLIGVIVGDRFPTIYACILEQLSKDYHILCKRLKWHNGKPMLSDDLWLNG